MVLEWEWRVGIRCVEFFFVWRVRVVVNTYDVLGIVLCLCICVICFCVRVCMIVFSFIMDLNYIFV